MTFFARKAGKAGKNGEGGQALTLGGPGFQVVRSAQTTDEQEVVRVSAGIGVAHEETLSMRILARFPTFDDRSLSPRPRLIQEHAAVAVETPAPASIEFCLSDDEPLDAAECPPPPVERVRLDDRLKHAISPRRRGLREVRAGWGSISFLALVAAGVWALAWWRDLEMTQVVDPQTSPHVATAPLESPDQLIR